MSRSGLKVKVKLLYLADENDAVAQDILYQNVLKKISNMNASYILFMVLDSKNPKI